MPFEELVRDADYDGALAALDNKQKRLDILSGLAGHPRARLRRLFVIAEVLDYGGLYIANRSEIVGLIERHAITKRTWTFVKEHLSMKSRSEGDANAHDLDTLKDLKQGAWGLIQIGMSCYRDHPSNGGYQRALDHFTAAETVLEFINPTVSSPGSLARAWYCIGLVRRQRQLADAHDAFTRSIEIGWNGMNKHGNTPESFKMSLGRAYGLGVGWVAYNRSALGEASCDVVAARSLMTRVHARFIRSYIEIIHACIIMSAHSNSATHVDAAIEILKTSYAQLGGDIAIAGKSPAQQGHAAYALRCAIELSLAHLRRALAVNPPDQSHVAKALEYATKVEKSNMAALEARSYCNAMIAKSRIYRASKKYNRALSAALQALRVAEDRNMEFTRIDAFIAVGEGHYWKGRYREAIDAFENALKYGKANPKVFAICHLQLARAYFQNSQRSKARDCYKTWRQSGRGEANGFVRHLAAEVETMLTSKDFQLGRSELVGLAEPRAKNAETLFHAWLAQAAVDEKGTRDMAAEWLGLKSAQTITAWENARAIVTEGDERKS